MQVLNSDFEPGDGGGVGQGDLLEGVGYHCHRSGHKCYSRYLDQVQYFFKTVSKQKVKVWRMNNFCSFCSLLFRIQSDAQGAWSNLAQRWSA